jgi:Tol biopolymer transport system component
VARAALLILLAACGRLGFDEVESVTPCTAWDVFGAPRAVTELNTGAVDWAPSLAADERTLYFSSNRSGNQELYRATRDDVGDAWSAPELLVELAAAGDLEEDPSISRDGTELFWGKAGIVVSRLDAASGRFGPGEVVIASGPGLIDPQGAELSDDGRSLYFNAQATPGRDALFVAARASAADPFAAPASLAYVDPDGVAGWPTLTADELDLVFSSDRAGDRDLWIARRASRTATFAAPVALTELNAPGEDWDPELSADGATIYFASDRGNAAGSTDLYVAERDCLE